MANEPTPPGKVRDLRAHSLPDGQVRLEWQAPETSVPITSYYMLRFAVSPDGSRAWETTRMLSPRVHEIVDTPPRAGTYRYMVGALNEDGSGKGSEVMVAVGGPVPIPPRR